MPHTHTRRSLSFSSLSSPPASSTALSVAQAAKATNSLPPLPVLCFLLTTHAWYPSNVVVAHTLATVKNMAYALYVLLFVGREVEVLPTRPHVNGWCCCSLPQSASSHNLYSRRPLIRNVKYGSSLNFLFSAKDEHTLVVHFFNRVSDCFSPSRRACFLISCFFQDFCMFCSFP